MKALLILFIFLVGCKESTDYRNVPFLEMKQEKIKIAEHASLCERKPESIFCKKTQSIGDIKPTKEYALEVLREMNSNFKYTHNGSWIYNDSIYENLHGDCEDIASTMAKHMVEDGIDTKYLHLALRKTSERAHHIFLAVDTLDAGMLHLDYGNSGYKIEDRINFHMRMDDAGVDKWVKGNIK